MLIFVLTASPEIAAAMGGSYTRRINFAGAFGVAHAQHSPARREGLTREGERASRAGYRRERWRCVLGYCWGADCYTRIFDA